MTVYFDEYLDEGQVRVLSGANQPIVTIYRH